MSIAEKLELLVTLDPSQGIRGLDEFSKKSQETGSKIGSDFSKIGAAALKLGVAGLTAGTFLTALGDKERQASAQLEASITAAGQSVDDYTVKIEAAVKAGENFGTSAVDTKTALTTLVGAYGDTGAALNRMQLVEDLAAARHISLASAADLVAKVHAGSTKALKLFDIQVGQNADGTKNYEGALDSLSKKVSGQASASVQGFTGLLEQLRAKLEDAAASFGEKYGVQIQTAAAALTVFGGVASGIGTIIEKVKLAHDAAAAAADGEALSEITLGGALLTAGAAILPLAGILPLMKISLDGNAAAAKETASEMSVFAQAVKEAASAGDVAITRGVALNIVNSHIYDTMKRLGIIVSDMASDVRKASPELVNLQDALHGAGNGTREFHDAISSARDSADPFVKQLVALYDAGKINDFEFRDLVGTTVSLGQELDTTAGKAKDTTTVETELGVATDKVKFSTLDMLDAMKKLNDERLSELDGLAGVKGAELALTDSQITAREKLDALTKAQKDHKLSADQQTQAVDDAKSAILREADAAGTAAEKTAAFNGVTDTAPAKQAAMVKSLTDVRDTLAPGSPLRQYLTDYILQLLSIPTGRSTTLSIVTRDGGVVANLGGGMQARAGGGPVMAGRAYVVGEDGPEVLVPSTSGFIVPNSKTSVGASGVSSGQGNGVTFAPNIVVNALDARGASLAVLEALREAVRTYPVPDAIKQALTLN